MSTCRLFLLLVVVVVGIATQEEATTESDLASNSTWTSGNNSQDAYVIKSVQFEIGVVEDADEGSGENGTTPEPAQTDKLSETKVAFLLPPGAVFNASQLNSTP